MYQTKPRASYALSRTIRAEGRPLLSAVERHMALGSGSHAAAASFIQVSKSVKGEAVRVDSSSVDLE